MGSGQSPMKCRRETGHYFEVAHQSNQRSSYVSRPGSQLLDLARRVRHRRGPVGRRAPFGHAGHRLHEWMFATRFWGAPPGRRAAGVDNAFAERQASTASARRSWAPASSALRVGRTTRSGGGWWGPGSAVPTPTYVLTHTPAAAAGDGRRHDVPFPRSRAGGCARRSPGRRADGQDVRIGGGPRDAARVPRRRARRPSCMSCRSRSCSAAASGCGTVWTALEEPYDVEVGVDAERRHPSHLHPMRLGSATPEERCRIVPDPAGEAATLSDGQLPPHHVRLPDERARFRADEGDARVARLQRGARTRRGRRDPVQHVLDPRDRRQPLRRAPG